MSFIFRCPFCNQKLECDDAQEGQVATCPVCKEEIVPTREQGDLETNPHLPSDSPKQSHDKTEQNMPNDNFRTCHAKDRPQRPLKIKIIACVLLIIFSCTGIYYYNYNKNLDFTKYCEHRNKRIMTEALLDLAKYPGSSDVVIKSYDDFPNANFITADGYIDMANAFGVKSRYEFSFHVEKYITRERFFFSLFGGQKIIMNKKDLGLICLKDHQGEYHFIHAEERWGR